jgi:photosystem II stability/assembly factor-like uncharacterized protein
MSRIHLGLVLSALIATAACFALPDSTKDRLDMTAPQTRLIAKGAFSGAGLAGTRIVAVGARGLIAVSDDQAANWKQVPSPVASDLVAVRFVDASQGWIVGHDGVVLHSSDGGSNWQKQMDGRQAQKLLAEHFARLDAQGDPEAKRWLKEISLNYANGPEQSLLDLWFDDKNNGYVVGSFGTVFRTTDGGASWQPLMEKVRSADLVHLNAIRKVNGELYLASERGVVFKLDRTSGRFEPMPTGYKGSFFGLVEHDAQPLAFGLLGNAYLSSDAGKAWTKVETGLSANVTGAVPLSDGRVLLLGLDGAASLLDLKGKAAVAVKTDYSKPLTGAIELSSNKVLLVGQGGLRFAALP